MEKSPSIPKSNRVGILGLVLLALIGASFLFFRGNSDKPQSVEHHLPEAAAVSAVLDKQELELNEDGLENHDAPPKTRAASLPEEPQSSNRLQQGLMQMVEIGYMREGVRSFIDEHGMEDLDVEQKMALGKTLQLCGFMPIMDADAYAIRKSDLEVRGADLSETERICEDVKEDEVYASYELLMEAAETGDFYAVHLLATALPPEFLNARMHNLPHIQPPEEKKIMDRYAPRINALLTTAIQKGSVRAALDMANRYDTGVGQPKDPIKALAYYEAAQHVLGEAGNQPYIDLLSSRLFLHEIETANREAEEIVRRWEQVGNLVY